MVPACSSHPYHLKHASMHHTSTFLNPHISTVLITSSTSQVSKRPHPLFSTIHLYSLLSSFMYRWSQPHHYHLPSLGDRRKPLIEVIQPEFYHQGPPSPRRAQGLKPHIFFTLFPASQPYRLLGIIPYLLEVLEVFIFIPSYHTLIMNKTSTRGKSPMKL